MNDKKVILDKVISVITDLSDAVSEQITEDSKLIGGEAIVTSRALVEALLELEEFAEDQLGVEFDWSSDSAMSQSRSIFRTTGSLADHLFSLKKAD